MLSLLSERACVNFYGENDLKIRNQFLTRIQFLWILSENAFLRSLQLERDNNHNPPKNEPKKLTAFSNAINIITFASTCFSSMRAQQFKFPNWISCCPIPRAPPYFVIRDKKKNKINNKTKEKKKDEKNENDKWMHPHCLHDCIMYIHKFNNNQRFNSIWWKLLLPFSLWFSNFSVYSSHLLWFMFIFFFCSVSLELRFFSCLCTETSGLSLSLTLTESPSWLLFIVYAGTR